MLIGTCRARTHHILRTESSLLLATALELFQEWRHRNYSHPDRCFHRQVSVARGEDLAPSCTEPFPYTLWRRCQPKTPSWTSARVFCGRIPSPPTSCWP